MERSSVGEGAGLLTRQEKSLETDVVENALYCFGADDSHVAFQCQYLVVLRSVTPSQADLGGRSS